MSGNREKRNSGRQGKDLHIEVWGRFGGAGLEGGFGSVGLVILGWRLCLIE